MLLHWALLGILISALPFDYDEDPQIRCLEGLPSSLSFVEKLRFPLKPSDIVIFSGGHSFERRQSGYCRLSAQSIEQLAKHHGYRHVFLDQLEYNRELKIGHVTFAPLWHRVFAMPALRAAFPDARFFVWLDDDILVPYKETDMLNHFVNYLALSDQFQMLYGTEGADYVLNSGMFIMRNSDFSFKAYEKAIELALRDNARLAHNFGHEQEAIAKVRSLYGYERQILLIEHRYGRHNFNTFARDVLQDSPEMKAVYGDAFVHFTGQDGITREQKMLVIMKEVDKWRRALPHYCKFPLAT